METAIEDFSFGLFIWQALLILGFIAVVIIIYKLMRKRKNIK